MKLTAITRFKVGELYAAIRRLGWSQTELARRCKLSVGSIGQYMNLHKKPREQVANKIQQVLAEAGQYIDVTAIWPETFKGFKKSLVIEQTQEVSAAQLEDFEQHYAAMLEQDSPERKLLLEEAIDSLKEPRDRQAIEEFLEGKTLDHIAHGKSRTTGQHRIESAVKNMQKFLAKKEEKTPIIDQSTIDYAKTLPRYECGCKFEHDQRIANPYCPLHGGEDPCICTFSKYGWRVTHRDCPLHGYRGAPFPYW